MGARRVCRPWTAEEADTLLALLREHGRDWVRIGEAIDRTPAAVEEYFKRQCRLGVWDRSLGRTLTDWSPAMLDRLAHLILTLPGSRGERVAAAAKLLGVSHIAARNKVQLLQEEGRLPMTPGPSVWRAWTPPEDEAARLWAQAEATTADDLERHRLQHHITVAFDDPAPVALCFISDQHIRESGPVEMRRMREDAELIRDTEGAYAVLGGDGVDNAIKHLTMMAHGGSRPSREWVMFEHYLGFFGPADNSKVLAAVSGNHDDWTQDKAGVNVLERLYRQRRLAFAPDEATIAVQHHGRETVIKIRHQYRFNSAFNPTHSIKRLWEMGDTDFDVGVLCHLHEPAFEWFAKHGKRRLAMRPGSYQYTSAYSRQRGYNSTMPTCPTVILDATGLAHGFPDLREAMSFLTYLRSQHGAAA